MNTTDEMLKAKADVLFYGALRDGIIKAISESVGDKDYCYLSEDDIKCTKILWGEHLLSVMRSCQEAEERLRKCEAEKEAGTQFTLFSDEVFNSLTWETRRATDLPKEIDGYTIAGIEPIIDGFKDGGKDMVIGGINLYLTCSGSEKIKVLRLETDIYDNNDETDSLQMAVAYHKPA